jgi:hypothetical protein
MAQVPVCFAWGEESLYEVNHSGHVWGARFELLPGATMANAACMLSGIIGVEASEDCSGAEPVYRAVPDDALTIYAMPGTDPAALKAYLEEIASAYRLHVAQMGMAQDA